MRVCCRESVCPTSSSFRRRPVVAPEAACDPASRRREPAPPPRRRLAPRTGASGAAPLPSWGLRCVFTAGTCTAGRAASSLSLARRASSIRPSRGRCRCPTGPIPCTSRKRLSTGDHGGPVAEMPERRRKAGPSSSIRALTRRVGQQLVAGSAGKPASARAPRSCAGARAVARRCKWTRGGLFRPPTRCLTLAAETDHLPQRSRAWRPRTRRVRPRSRGDPRNAVSGLERGARRQRSHAGRAPRASERTVAAVSALTNFPDDGPEP